MPITTCSYGPFRLNAYSLGGKRSVYEEDEEDDMGMLPGGLTQNRPTITTPSTGAKQFTTTTTTTTTTNQAVQDLLKNKDIQNLLERINKNEKVVTSSNSEFPIAPLNPTGINVETQDFPGVRRAYAARGLPIQPVAARALPMISLDGDCNDPTVDCDPLANMWPHVTWQDFMAAG